MTLKWSLVAKGMRPHEQLRTKLQQKVSKLESHLEHVPPDAAHLQVSLQRHPKRVWFTAALTLRLPSNILRSAKSGEDPVPAFDQAIKAMLREIGGLKSALRRESQWRPLSPIGRLPEIKAPRLAQIPAIAGQL
jgi:ribosome-associated translation inhibitor RaiA